MLGGDVALEDEGAGGQVLREGECKTPLRRMTAEGSSDLGL